MFNLLYVVDPHARATNPRNRKDDYKDTFFLKIREIFQIAWENECKAIICSGDLLDLFSVSDNFKNELVDLLDESPVEIWTTPGNHELNGYNLSTYESSSLKVIERMSKKLCVVFPGKPVFFTDPDVQISFTPYSGKMDIDGYGYDLETEEERSFPGIKVQVSHGMAIDHVPPFDRYSLLDDIKTSADLVLTGHDHTGYGRYVRYDNKTFCNPGSITRIKASTTEIERPICVSLIYCNDSGFSIEFVPLQTAKPGEEVLDRSIIEMEQKRDYAMEQFTTLIQAGSQKIALNVNQAIEEIAKKESYAPTVVKKVLEKIDLCRGRILL